ncbi:MAG: ATP-binding protein [Bacteroidaceae bacterium]|mgnify:FL=1|nr:ATP-binding protein [Bacteroidaceae bacterium]
MEYRKSIVGRKHEQEILQMCVDSPKAEFIAVYGRRRIGKTYLVKQFFGEKFDFYTTGIYNVSRAEQLKRWQEQLYRYSGTKRTRPKDWFEAFMQLQEFVESLSDKECVSIFIDELPWLDTPKSGFIRALELFWNSWAADRRGLKLVVCGSATTWMTNKLLGDKGGLHNRVTRAIRLSPFTLKETEEYLKSIGIEWARSEVLDAYMILGGTPFYLSLLRPELSLSQNVDELFYSQNATLNAEYDFLFTSLFNNAALYRRVVETLASKLRGMTREELIKALKVADNGLMSEVLDNLRKCDFIRSYQAFGKKEKGAIFQLADMYTLFYLRFVKNYYGLDEHAWSKMNDARRNVWAGYAFEQVCIHHINQIRQALGISGIASDVSAWYCKDDQQGAQIDLVIDRSDKSIDLCEMKYCDHQFELKKEYVEWMRERRELFKLKTGTRKSLRLTMVSSGGIKLGKYSSAIQGNVVLDDLFE